MNILKLILLTTMNCLIAVPAFGSGVPAFDAQAPDQQEEPLYAPCITTVHGTDPQTLAALNRLADAAKNIKIEPTLSTETSIRYVGVGVTLLAAVSILCSGEVNKINGAALSTGVGALLGARTIGNSVDSFQKK